jgi:two-component system, NarL family, nitrate/nitrite response regulator NarL
MATRIVIVDDHDVVRQGVRSIIAKARPEWEICGEAANGEQAVQSVVTVRPDVVVLDITMPVMNGLEAASKIVKLVPSCRVLVLTMHESERLCADIQLIGAHGYVQKSQAGRDLVRAIDHLLTGGTFFSPEAQSKSDDTPNPGTSFSGGLNPARSRCSAFLAVLASASSCKRVWRQSRREQPCLQCPS